MSERVLAEIDCSTLIYEWPKWKGTFLMYMMASGKDSLPEAKKIATFLWLAGPGVTEIYNTIFPNDGSANSMVGNVAEAGPEAAHTRTLDDVIKALDEYAMPLKNITMETFKFNNIVQQENQQITDFVTNLRKQANFCEFKCECGKSFQNRMLLDRLIIGIQDKRLQMKLLDNKNKGLEEVVQECKAFEASTINTEILSKAGVPQQTVDETTWEKQDKKGVWSVTTRRCYNCGALFNKEHINECKAREVQCFGCGKMGHFSKYCKTKKQEGKGVVSNWNKSGMSNKERVINDSTNYNHYSVSQCGFGTSKWNKTLEIYGKRQTFKIDTGADINCIPINLIENIPIRKQHEVVSIFDYNKAKIMNYGTILLKCLDIRTNIYHSISFLIVEEKCEPILGLETAVKLELIKCLNIDSISLLPSSSKSFVEMFKALFEGLGKLPWKQSIVLKENAEPTIHYRKRFPHSILGTLKKELKQMEREGIISPVSYPTSWVNNLQLVEKSNGKLRLCLDPKPLNKAIKREHFLIPTIEDFTTQMVGKKHFTVLDLSKGFWQMELDKNSSDLTTFMTPFGRYRFNRVPFGINSAPEMFQRNMVQIFGDLPNVLVYFDDIIVMGNTLEEHDVTLSNVLERARINGVKFNPDKVQYRQEQVEFMGHIISENKIQPQKKHLEAIRDIKTPTDKAGVLRILGLFKYLAKFIPDLSARSANLRELTKNDVKFTWSKEHEEELQNLTKTILEEPVLAVYDKNKPVTIQTDASKDGLGCVLIQDSRPVCFASRTLSKSEKKWAQIEKELLAIVFACERFHYFVYGREFLVESDHKPLEILMEKDIDSVTMRLQRMLLYLLKYPNIKVQYKPGKEMLIADCLSRAQLIEENEIQDLSNVIHVITKAVCLSESNFNVYKDILNADEDYSKIVDFVKNGWPSYHKLNNFCQRFHKIKSELHFENGLLMRTCRLIVPKRLQPQIMKQVHSAHLGIEKTLARARECYYWPNMSTQIKESVESCRICEKFRRKNQKEPLIEDEMPEYPFHMVGMDIFEFEGADFLSIFDSYSNFVIVRKLKNKSVKQIISELREVFDSLGYPTKIKSDNNPFNSTDFKEFANNHNIVLQFSSPHYPQSNGLAEKGVAIAKNILKRCAKNRDSYQYNILEYNSTPIASMQTSPCELFFGRNCKTKLPIAKSSLCRNNISEKDVIEKIQGKRSKQKQFYDRNTKTLTLCQLGEKIMFRRKMNEWAYGLIEKKVNSRSYIIKDRDNNYYRRNRKFIAKTKNQEEDDGKSIVDLRSINFWPSSDDKEKETLGDDNEIETCIESESNVLVNANNCSENITNCENNHNITNNLTVENCTESESDVLNNANDCNENKTNYEISPNPPDSNVSNVDDNILVLRTRSGREVKKPKKFL